MKHIFAIALLSLIFSSCCTKKYCVTWDTVYLSFQGFTPDELDTIYTTGYVRGSGFTQLAIDRKRDTVSLNDDSTYYFRTIEGDLLGDICDWELYIPATGKTYRISDYSYSEFACNCPKDKVRSLEGCRIDGVSQNAHPAVITK